MTDTYPPPVAQLFTLGRPAVPDWSDYIAMGLADEHVPALLALMEDEGLSWEDRPEDADETPYWAPTHAWRALGQLRAESAVGPLIHVLLSDEEDDWATEDIPQVLGMIGPAALRAVRAALGAEARGDDVWGPIYLAASLREIGTRHPEARDQAIDALVRQLRLWEFQDPELNGFLVHDLLELRAMEAVPVMQEAYAGGGMDESIVGDWEDVQVYLGLLPERATPPPRHEYVLPRLGVRPARGSAPIPGSTSAAAKSRQLRKAQKQAAKKKRRK